MPVNIPLPIILTPELEAKFWARAKAGTKEECWPWNGAVHKKTGYPHLSHKRRSYLAHRVSAAIAGIIFDFSLIFDHECTVRRCVNPYHLKQKKQRENVLRGSGPTAINAAKTRCVNGHEFTAANTYTKPNITGRRCRTCRKEAQQRRDGTWQS